MKVVKERILRSIVKVAENAVGNDDKNWPPSCIGYIYQPKRPVRSSSEVEVTKKTKVFR